MKRSIHFLETLFCLLLLIFAAGRVGFMLYNRHIETFSFFDVLHVLRTGLLSHDIFIVALLLVVPWLAALVAVRRKGFPLRAILTPYYILMGVAVSLIIVADIVMYEFWQFKLSAVVLSYAASPEGVTNSVSVWFLLLRIFMLLALMLLLIVPCVCLTPKHLECSVPARLWMRNITIIWTFILFISLFFMRIGDAYFSPRLFLNHAAVNPVYAFATSFPMEKSYTLLEPEEQAEAFRDLYPEKTEDILPSDTLLRTQRPNILIVLIESFGGKFVKELGGLPDVSPNWSRLIPEGIFWENYYSNSFRTDRGTVSTYSGWISYPTVSLMKHTKCHEQLPSIAKTLSDNGYTTSYLYAGAMTNMGKAEYLRNMHFQQLLDHTAFTADELSTGWGVNDSISAMKAYHLIAETDSTAHWLMAYQTLSSHEPWIVPYHRLEDEKLNAFAFTDHCLGQLVDSLKTLPQWDNMLVIMLPDHGFLYEQSYEVPEFFHSPMLWLGGAIREPRRMRVFMNQSDLAATLLSQMGIGHDDYPWSRNVLSAHYKYPFVYCNFPAGILFADSTGVSIFDIIAGEVITELPVSSPDRIRKAQAILQETNY